MWKWMIGIGLAIFAGWYVGANKWFDYAAARTNRLHAVANEAYDRQGDKLEEGLGNNPNAAAIREAARQHHVIKAEKETNDSLIRHYTASCPNDPKKDPTSKTIKFDVRDCPDGQGVYVDTFNKFQEGTYQVSLYDYKEKDAQGGPVRDSKGDPLTKPVAARPRFAPLSADGFSAAACVDNPTTPNSSVCVLAGEVKYLVSRGAADYVVMELK